MIFQDIWQALTGKTPLREAFGATIDADEDQWRPLSGDAERDLAPMSQARMRQIAFWLWENNALANRLIELPLAYLLAEGVDLRGRTQEAQDVLRRFWLDPINNMEMKLPKKVRELALFGEQCYPVFINEMDGAVRLGYLDLLAAGDWLDAYDDFLFGEFDRARFLRAFVWDVTLSGANEEQVKKRMATVTAPSPGSVRVHNETETWQAVSPTLNAGDSTENARLFRNHILAGQTIPEHWFGGGGELNRVTGDSMMEPTFKTFSMRQRQVQAMLEEIGCYVLRQAAIVRGEQPQWDDEAFDCEAVFPEMTAKDTSKYAAALQQGVTACVAAVSQGLMSRETAVRVIVSIAGRLGLEVDAEAELKQASDEAGKLQEQDAFFAKAVQDGATA